MESTGLPWSRRERADATDVQPSILVRAALRGGTEASVAGPVTSSSIVDGDGVLRVEVLVLSFPSSATTLCASRDR
jgi:hypothetical protein